MMPTIVLLPGMDGTGTLFQQFASALGSEFKVVIVRYPTDDKLGYRELEDIARQALPTHGDFIILGESFSGPIAVTLASQNPDGLIGLVLCSTFIRTPKPRLKPLRSLTDFLPVKLAPSFLYSYFLLGRFATPSLNSSIKAAVSQVSSAAFQARLRAVLDVDVTTPMKMTTVPVLYLRALQDRLVLPAASEYISEVRPGTTIVTVDAPHFLLQVAAETAAHIVKKFVREQCN